MPERSFINGITRAETSVIDGAIRDNFRLNWYENLSVENFKDGIWVSKDESILERERVKSYISIDGRWVSLG